MDNPLISVIMPCYNAQAYVEQAVNSVLNQINVKVELIVVDDGSGDNSTTILATLSEKNPERIKLFSQHNKGPYPARNYGIRQAKGSYIAFLDADDYWEHECLSILLKALEEQQADIAYCGWQNIGRRKGIEPYIPPIYEQGDISEAFLTGCPWPIHAALTRRSVLDRVDGFSERYFSSMDYDLWLRISAITQNIVHVGEVLAYYRWHDSGQISAAIWRQVQDSWRVRRDFIKNHPDRIKHFDKKKLCRLRHQFLHQKAFDAYWQRDLVSAQKLLRVLFWSGYWKAGELKYVLPSLLPEKIYHFLFSNTSGQ